MKTSVKTLLAFTLGLASAASANDLLSESQFVDYSAKQHCINQEFWDQPEKQDAELMALEKEFGITDDNFDAVDALIVQYQQNSDLQGQVEVKAKELCPAK